VRARTNDDEPWALSHGRPLGHQAYRAGWVTPTSSSKARQVDTCGVNLPARTWLALDFDSPVASTPATEILVRAVTGRSRPGSNLALLKLGTLNSRQERLRAKGVGPRYSNTPRSGTIRYIAVVGGRVQVPSRKVGEAPRDGVVTGVTGSLLRVRWSTGEESTVVPSMGSLAVVGKQSSSGGRRRQTTSASAAKGQVSR
jgi:hypothetical protein